MPQQKAYGEYRKSRKAQEMEEKDHYAHELTPDEEWKAMQFDEDYDKGYRVFDHCHWTGMLFFTISTTNLLIS